MLQKLSRRQWLVLLGACLFQCGMIGVLVNCSGVLFAQMRAELGLSMAKISAYNTTKGLSGALASAAVTALFFKSNKKWYLTINQLLLLGSFVLLILNTHGAVWYLSAFLCALGTSISSVAAPSVLNQWFPENAGSATGIAMAFSGLGGAVCNPLCAFLISMYGWRTSILILGTVMMLFTIPGIHLMFRWDPPNSKIKHVLEKTDASDPSTNAIPTFILLSVALLAGGVGVQFAINISIYAQSIGYSLTVGASLATMVMIGNVCGKFLYGYLCDALGAWHATMSILICIAVAALSFIFAQANLFILHIAALLFGVAYALSMVGLSRCGVAAYGLDGYKKYIGLHSCINSIAIAASSMLFGMVFDITQSIVPILRIVLAMSVISFGAVTVLSKKKT